MEEGASLLRFSPSQAHAFLLEVYGDYLHKNNGTYLYGGVDYNSLWKLTSWYGTPLGEVGRKFTARLSTGWQRVRAGIWKSEQPLIFAQSILKQTQGARLAKETQHGPFAIRLTDAL